MPSEPIVDLAPGAEDNPLAVRFADFIRRNVRDRPQKNADFRALRGAVLVVARDVATALTLRFDHGRCTVHDGAIGVPSVTFCGDARSLERLADLPLTPWVRLPIALPFRNRGRDTFRELVRQLGRGDLKIYGLMAHPRLVTRFLRLVSSHP